MIEEQNFCAKIPEFEIPKGNLKLSVFWPRSQFLSKPSASRATTEPQQHLFLLASY
jgi:hypothetical protein